MWVDTSSLATSVLLEHDNVVFEDACWLQPTNNAQHINLAEFNAALRGINLALQWKCKVMLLKTDSVSMYHWLVDTLTGKTRVRTKATSEMLLRQRLETIKSLVEVYGLSMDVALIPSIQNLADPMTQVPQRWLERMKSATEPVPLTCAVRSNGMTSSQIMKVHESSGHPGIRCTAYFAQRVCPTITKADVRSAIRACEQCQTIDPAPVHWTKGGLAVKANWQKLGIDITHYNGKNFLTVTDCGPARFTIWRPLPQKDSRNIIQHLEAIFFECSPPQELLTDNDTAFSSTEFSASSGVHLRFWCAYVPASNSIVEWCHHSIKRIAARTRCSVQEAMYWYNIMPKDDTSSLTAPVHGIYRYEVRIRNIDPVPTSPAYAQNRERLVIDAHPSSKKEWQQRWSARKQLLSTASCTRWGMCDLRQMPFRLAEQMMRLQMTLPTSSTKWRNLRTILVTKHMPEVANVTLPVLWSEGCLENAWRGKRHSGEHRNGNEWARLDRKQSLYSFA